MDRIPELIFKELRGEISESEREELQEWVAGSEENGAFYEQFTSEERLHAGMTEFYEFQRNVWERITKEVPELQIRVVPIMRRTMFYAAAAVLLLVATGGYWWLNRRRVAPGAVVEAKRANVPQNIVPGGNKAVLTLADGSAITLDSARNGLLTQQGNVKVVKVSSGQLVYNALHEKPAGMLYNTLATPRGGQYRLDLPDGTMVWLNAASSIKYPIAFKGKQREVELEGEAYFEVKENKSMPFVVKTRKDVYVEVLGTHFNIMAYEDEPELKTTLLAGSVRVTKGMTSKMVRPGQQIKVDDRGNLQLIENADTDAAVAWKNGYFEFNAADIGTVMRAMSRWYDIDIIYTGRKPEGHFLGEIGRNNNLSDVLKMLEVNGVHFRLEGRKLIVL